MRISVSTVTPVYSGAQCLKRLVQELGELREQWESAGAPVMLAEAIFVDDAAVDDSGVILDELAASYPWVTVLHLSRNFGQHPATIAGILHSSGDWVVTLDEDLQHPPNQIERMLRRAVTEGLDVVYASPQDAVHEAMLRDYTSRAYKRLMASVTGNRNIPLFNSFRLLRGAIARAASSVCGHETYFDVAVSWFTNRVDTVTMKLKDHRTIQGHQSGYNLLKLLSHARRLIVSTHAKALRTGAVVGILLLIASTSYGAWVLYTGMRSPSVFGVQGWASLMVAILFLGGVAVSLIGVLLEYVAVILLHTQGKPAFFVVDRGTDAMLAQYYQDHP